MAYRRRLARPCLRRVTCLVLLTLVATTLAENNHDNDTSRTRSQQHTCRFYVAPSSTGAPHGYYAGVSLSPGDPVGPPGTAIQIARLPPYVGNEDYLEDLLWTPDATGGAFEIDDEHDDGEGVVTVLPGVGTTSAYHAEIANAAWDHLGTLKRAADFPGRAPGASAGAYSDYHNVTARATRAVRAGEEIFLDFGDEWMAEPDTKDKDKDKDKDKEKEKKEKKDDDDDDDDEQRFTQSQYEDADRRMRKVYEFFEKHRAELEQQNDDQLRQKTWTFLRTVMRESHVTDILPDHIGEASDDVREYGSFLARFLKDGVVRDLDWLRTHGRCVDGLTVHKSDIPYAGRGAFATRSFRAGEVVTTTPVAVMHHKDRFVVWEKETEQSTENTKESISTNTTTTDALETGDESSSSKQRTPKRPPLQPQLLVNYCFAHPDSSVLLLPYGNAVNHVNHASRWDERNAAFRWSTDHAATRDALERPPTTDVALLLNVVALRDVRKGEEILVDYGRAWEAAWYDHALRWTPPADGDDYVRPVHANAAWTEQRPFRTETETEEEEETEHRSRAYNLRTACFVSEYVTTSGATELENDDDDDPWRELAFKRSDWIRLRDTFDGESLRACRVLEREDVIVEKEEKDENDSSTDGDDAPKDDVVLHFYTVLVRSQEEGKRTPVVVRGVPHEALLFVDEPGRGDAWLSNAFRHPIGLGDAFPEAWKDLRTEPTEDGAAAAEESATTTT